jgi:hypothetical protein
VIIYTVKLSAILYLFTMNGIEALLVILIMCFFKLTFKGDIVHRSWSSIMMVFSAIVFFINTKVKDIVFSLFGRGTDKRTYIEIL